MPTREVLDGVLIVLGGALLLTPGFVTDVFGLLLLLPPTRAVVRRLLGRRVLRRLRVSGTPGARRAPAGWDVDGTATDVDPPALR